MIDLKRQFINDFSKAMLENNAAVFAGAGLSVPAGYVNWKELLREFSESIGLSVDKEHDLISLAQYYKNSTQSKNHISQNIIEEFTKNAKENEMLNVITKMPINTYWTTNYDTLIEDSLKKYNKRVDVKIDNNDLSITKSNIDSIVYKFHGDISRPYEAVLTRDDYEKFDQTHKLFIHNLQGDLISKTFVFVGYSLNDPDIQQILSKIRILVGENIRSHYCFRKNVSLEMFKNSDTPQEDFNYAKIKQELEINDLRRYGIHTLLVEDYSDITSIFKQCYQLFLSHSIFIAGSCRDYSDWNSQEASSMLYKLGYKLIENNIIVSSGNIEGVGPQIINGAITSITERNYDISKYLKIKTLPLIAGKDTHINIQAKKKFQNNMISEAGIVIFLFGNQYYDNTLQNSRGVIHDFRRAVDQNRFVIPVASTGWASLEIFQEILSNFSNYSYLKDFMDQLLIERDPDKLSDLIISCIKYIKSSFILK